MMDQPVDGGGRRHLVSEDPIPLAEEQVARQHHGAALVAFGEQRKEHLRLFRALLDVAQIIEQHDLEVVELAQGPWQRKVALLSLIHISEPTRLGMISYAVFCLKKKKK